MDNLSRLFSVKNKVIVITGGAGFLGSEYSLFLARAGARVVIIDLQPPQALTRVAENISRRGGVKPLTISADITDEPAVKKAVKEILRRYGRIDVLINNAALTYSPSQAKSQAQFSPYEKYPLPLWKRAIDVGLTGAFIMARAVIPAMKKKRSGVIINISSIYGITAYDNRIYGRGRFGSIAYATTKSAALNFTRALASYLAPYGIRVNTLIPGGTWNNQDKKFVANYSARAMLGRMAERDDFNGAVLFLASDASRYMTGASLVVDGGWSAW